MEIGPEAEVDLVVNAAVNSSHCGQCERFSRRAGVLGRALEQHGNLSAVGRLAMRAEIGNSAARYGRLHEAQVLGPQFDRLVVIGGLPRTGTTLLHSVLAAALPAFTLSPGMAFEPLAATRATAELASMQRYELLRAVGPAVAAMHPTDLPQEECTPLLQHSLACLQTVVMFDLGEEYWSETLRDGFQDTYTYWGSMISRLYDTYRTGSSMLLLKSPMHFYAYRELFEMTAEVELTLIHIRRDASAVVRSLLNLVAASRALFARSTDRHAIGAEWLSNLELSIPRAVDALKAPPSNVEVVDLDYRDLIANPVKVGCDLADRFGVEKSATGRLTPLPAPTSVPLARLEAFGLAAEDIRRLDNLGEPFFS